MTFVCQNKNLINQNQAGASVNVSFSATDGSGTLNMQVPAAQEATYPIGSSFTVTLTPAPQQAQKPTA